MASTYSDKLRLELISAGDQSGTWGDTTNTNLGTLIEEAIAGVSTIAMGDANQTLTANNGVTDEARKMVLKLTGTLTATREVVVPSKEKIYVVHNAATGGKVHVKTSGATGVEVSPGFKTILYCDGSTVISVMPQALNESTTAGNILSYDTTSGWIATSATGLAFSAGMIINWAGNISSPPSGWLVCDGSSQLTSAFGALHTAIGYTFGGSGGNFNLPDLRDKFVIGAGNTHSVAATGGSKDAITVAHTHTISGNTSNSGNHTHSYVTKSTTQPQNGSDTQCWFGTANANTGGAGAHVHNVSGNAASSGSSGTDANLPPYVALGYIIKT